MKISLLVKRKAGEVVFDTITKFIQVLKWEDAAYYGKYRGYEISDPNTIINVDIKRYDTLSKIYPGQPCFGGPCIFRNIIKNIPKDCGIGDNEIFEPTIAGSYRQFRIISLGHTEVCQDVKGIGSLVPNGEIIINYSVRDKNNNYNYVPKKFIGKKIE